MQCLDGREGRREKGRERGSAETSVASITADMTKWSYSPFLMIEDIERPTLEDSSAIAFLSSLSMHSAASASRCKRPLTALDPCSDPVIKQSN